MCCALLSVAGLAKAESAFNCWISSPSSRTVLVFIRCIAERSPLADGLQRVSSSYDKILDVIQTQLHSGQVAEADATLRANAAQLRSSDYHSVLLYSYPTDTSWEQSLPQMLVQSALCGGGDCKTKLFRRP